MKAAIVAALAPVALALPQQSYIQQATPQLAFSLPEPAHVDSIAATLEAAVSKAGKWVDVAQRELDQFVDEVQVVADGVMDRIAYGGKSRATKMESAKVDDIEYERITHADFPEYAVRIRSPQGLCDPTVKQYSGYLDISDTKHLFFWLFESRSNPESDPFVIWLNGGPGCSSQTGNLMELGPCSATKDGNTAFNEYGWNSNANILFLDQPVAVGYSYTEGGDSINNSEDAAKDVYAFLQLFYSKFPSYSKLPLTVAAESYGGKYAPAIAHRIHTENKSKRLSSTALHVPLASVAIGNGLTEPYTQFASVPEYGCAPSEHAIFDEATCTGLRSKVGTCQRLQSYCYNSPGRFTCVPATLYCWSALYGPFQSTGLNPYDVRQKCDRQANPLCYEEMNWIEAYLNKAEVKKELGVPSSLEFQSCNMDVNRAFQMNGDNMHNAASLLPELLEDGIRLLVYAGVEDFMCNYIGNEEWMQKLDTPFTAEFVKHSYDFVTSAPVVGVNGEAIAEMANGKYKAGKVRFAGPGAGNYTYVSLIQSGHMVPHDQPAVALELLNKWLSNQPLV